jgi:glutamine cyclotransferase
VQTVAAYGYKIVNSYPHDTGAYTQGLFWHEGELWESTGEYGASTLRRVALETGGAVRSVAVPDGFFAEGAAILGGRVYQLTWLEKKCFVYDAATLERTGEFTYNGEGWGLTTDGARLYMSDGSANITVRNPADFSVERMIVVRNAGRPVQYLNELEWIDGKIWANLYVVDYREMTSPKTVIIDPASGAVEGVVDFTGIYGQLAVTSSTDVMNGIAHDPATGRTFVTGKRWNRLFEIEIFKK